MSAEPGRPTAPPIDAACQFCRYWGGVPGDTVSRCRINPPFADMEGHAAVWPVTTADDWCGRFTINPAVLRKTKEPDHGSH